MWFVLTYIDLKYFDIKSVNEVKLELNTLSNVSLLISDNRNKEDKDIKTNNKIIDNDNL